MPQAEGGYVSLDNGPNNTVYNATTEPTGPHSVIETLKRAIGHAMGGVQQDHNTLLGSNGAQPTIISIR